ncbi:MAG: EF-hand domain-containing protein [Sphingorhabdus sp.]
MLRILMTSTILAMTSVPAFAQLADPIAAPRGSEMATEVEPATTSGPAQPATETRAATVTRIVESEFPEYDANKSGVLEQAEFTKWMLALAIASTPNKTAEMDEAGKNKWAKGAFVLADSDQSTSVSKTEMNKFLQG